MTDIQILMGVCDGASFLPSQLQSLKDQTHTGWSLLASDDSADDASRDILESFSSTVTQNVQVIKGPQQGFAANFRHLIASSSAGTLAFADQDDVWLPEKLARGNAALGALDHDYPALYCARVQPWDEFAHTNAQPLPRLTRAPGFRNALIENVAYGNTILLNKAAADLARSLAPVTPDFFAHDWWLYQLITGVGGTVLHDDGAPVVLYRQHDANVIGAGRGWRGQWKRKRAVLRGAFAERLSMNSRALAAARAHLTPENAKIFDTFEAARKMPIPAKLCCLSRLGIYRQSRMGTAGFFGAAALGLV